MKRLQPISVILIILSTFSINSYSNNLDTIPESIYSGLKFRNISPAYISGRIADIVVNPNNNSEYYVAVAAGGIWKTINNGTTFKPIFDNYSVYSIGCLAMDPKNHNIIWAGSGENNHQRSISYGDGVYKSVDGGKSWKNMGLKKSFQIGRVLVHPYISNVVFVAAEGSVWGEGGDRGLFKTDDGGKNWKKVLDVSKFTGINNVEIDPINPKIMYATSEQRMRRTQTRIGGGPESALWKSTDGGENWRKITNGIPKVDKAGMGIKISPINENIVYLMIEASNGKGGFFKSEDKGESWKKMSSYNTSGQYFGEIYLSPFDENTIYSLETYSKFSIDGGKTWKNIGNNKRHVDDHAFWMDDKNKEHFMIGGDGGLYETYDGGKTYIHKLIPVTQFYRVAVDNAKPFYWIYGGTQDNSSLGAPSNTLYSDGITRAEWDITLGGDGFWQAVDETDPNIVYSEYQYGNLFRYNKVTGEKMSIKPREKEGEDLYKWNWNTPFILSKHNPQRLYMVANYVFQSDDRGQSWNRISDDITAKIDRNKWKVMDRYWGVDAVGKDVSTSLYGTGVSLAESPIKEGLVFVGTDDGTLSISSDNGSDWTKIHSFPGVPQYTYISDIEPSQFDENTVYVTFDNRKHFDFKPYILKSIDLGETWVNIAGNLDENLPVHTIKQDFIDENLLFVGTEFGLYFSNNEGGNWNKLKSGIPTISVRDIAIQKEEEDLVLATFGRGFYVLDDYSPLRDMNNDIFDKDFHLFEIKDAALFAPRNRGGYGFGSLEHTDKNQDFGAIFTYYVKEVPKTLKELRREKEKELIKNKFKIEIPTLDELRKESAEIKPYLVFVIKNKDGKAIRNLTQSIPKGINRDSWDLRYSMPVPMKLKKPVFDPLRKSNKGVFVLPGEYFLDVYMYNKGEIKELVKDRTFKVKRLMDTVEDSENYVTFYERYIKVYREYSSMVEDLNDLKLKAKTIKQVLLNTPGLNIKLLASIDTIDKKLMNIDWTIKGQRPKASREERIVQPVPLNDRMLFLNSIHYNTTTLEISQSEIYALQIIEKEMPVIIKVLEEIKSNYLPNLHKELKSKGAGWFR